MIFILFSGPPGSGKDTGAKIAYDWVMGNCPWHDPVWEKFSFPNKRAFAGMMKLPCMPSGYVGPWEDKKNEVIPELGVSYRQWQIDYSEKFMKPLYGDDILGKLLMQRCLGQLLKNPIFIVSDCGFQIEVDTIPDEHKVIFFDMYREGCDYRGDSRGRVEPKPHWTRFKIDNNGDLGELSTVIQNHLSVCL